MVHPAAVCTAHVNHDSELVIQPRLTEPLLTEQPQGNHPQPVLPGHPCLKPRVLLLAGVLPGRQGVNVSDSHPPSVYCWECCNVGSVAGCPGSCCVHHSCPCTSGQFASCDQYPLCGRIRNLSLPLTCLVCTRFLGRTSSQTETEQSV